MSVQAERSNDPPVQEIKRLHIPWVYRWTVRQTCTELGKILHPLKADAL